MRAKTKDTIIVALLYSMTLLVIASMGMTTACNRVHVTNTPVGIVDKEVALWFQATGAVKTWSDASLALTQAAVNLHSEFPDETTYQRVLAGLGRENQIGLQAAEFLQTVPQHFDATAQGKLAGFLDQGLASLDEATQVGLLQVKNQTEKQAIDASLASLRAALKTIFALTKPADTPVPTSLGGK